MKEHCKFEWFGQNWECVRGKLDDKDNGGECDNVLRRIVVDPNQDENDFLTILHHELMEGASYIVGCTHTRNYPETRDLFIMTHNEMNLVSISVRGAYEDIKIKIIGDDPLYKNGRSKPTRSAVKKKSAKIRRERTR